MCRGSSSLLLFTIYFFVAEIAQLVEHDLAKVGVAGSSPVFRSEFFELEKSGTTTQRENSSVGRARPCQGRGREFKSRFPLHKDDSKGHPFFVAGRVGRRGRVGLRGRVSVPPPRAVPQPVFNRHQIDLGPVFGTATLPTGAPEASRRGEGVIYRLFGTATLPTGPSRASMRGETIFYRHSCHETPPTGTPEPSPRGEAVIYRSIRP